MLSLPPGLKIYVASAPVDMRKSFDALAILVTTHLQRNVQDGHLFVFVNKRATHIKLFHWDRNGYCLWYKRLEQGAFRLPRSRDNVYKISSSELTLLLEGIELTHRQRLRTC